MKAVNVTTSSSEVTLVGGSASLTASVVNHEQSHERVVVAVVPHPGGSADASGGALAGAGPGAGPAESPGPTATVDAPLREVGPGATEQYLVTFAQGAAAAGRRVVKVVAYPVDEAPEEYAANGQLVAVVIPAADPPPPPKRRLPWWAWVVALVVVVAVILAVLLTRTRTVAVPNVVGKPRAEAVQLVADSGLTALEARQVSAPPLGVVLAQSPGAAAQVERGAQVRLTISVGVTVGDLTTTTLALAKAELERAGITVVTQTQASDAPAGSVIGQQPAAGAEVGLGESVTVVVAVPRSVTIPPLVGVTASAATTRLLALGLAPRLDVDTCLFFQCRRVGGTQPPAGTSVPKGSVVVVKVTLP